MPGWARSIGITTRNLLIRSCSHTPEVATIGFFQGRSIVGTMRRSALRSGCYVAILCALTLGTAAAPAAAAADGAPGRQLSFDVQEGRNLNSFLRADRVAAHLVLRSGSDPRILVAFPAGNSGVGLWFNHASQPVTWRVLDQPRPMVEHDAKGHLLYGIVAKVGIAGGTLVIKQAILSSVRVLRDYQGTGTVPQEVTVKPSQLGTTLTWARDRLDGAAGYRLSLEVNHGALQDDDIKADRDGRLEITLIALSGETPLTPLPQDKLLDARARPDRESRNTLTFLSYREKFLAGSWRFDTYFGRDTLMSLDLLMPALTPAAVEAGLDSVLARLSAKGEVAHEEDIGEFAILDHLRTDGTRSDEPTYNYNMIDGTFMLAPVARSWLLDDGRGRSHAADFLSRDDGRSGATQHAAGADLVSNLRLVVRSALAFGDNPRMQNLIGLKDSLPAGQWRDSTDGLGGGRYPYDVNAVLVPAALDAAARLYASGLLDPYVSVEDRSLLARAGALAQVWREKAPGYFEVTESNETARKAVQRYATALHVPADAALSSLGHGPLRFHALALKSDGSHVAVINSDEGFALLLSQPPPEALEAAVTSIVRPFPAGLLTDAGMVVANPVFAPVTVQEMFSNRAYHGTVIWSWQQAMMAEGLERQLRRRDLPDSVVTRLKDAQRRLWRVISAGKEVRNSELWSWRFEGGRYHVAPFGLSDADVDESNAAQLWSTVYLSIWPPKTSPVQ